MMAVDDYRALFRASPSPCLVMAPDLTIIGASGACLRSAQRTEEDIVGRDVFEAFPEYPDNPEATDISEVKGSLLREPGGPAVRRYIDLVYEPYKDQYGTTIGIFAQGHDATDAVESQAARRESDARLRADPANRHAVFAALTGYGQAHDRVLSRCAGFDRHFVKPMHVEQLGELLALAQARVKP